VTARYIDGILYYADPFGAALSGYPPKEIVRGPYIVNRIPFQRLDTSLCGYYAIIFAKAMDAIPSVIPQKVFENILLKAVE